MVGATDRGKLDIHWNIFPFYNDDMMITYIFVYIIYIYIYTVPHFSYLPVRSKYLFLIFGMDDEDESLY